MKICLVRYLINKKIIRPIYMPIIYRHDVFSMSSKRQVVLVYWLWFVIIYYKQL